MNDWSLHLCVVIICTCPLKERCPFPGSLTLPLISHHHAQSSGNSGPSIWPVQLPHHNLTFGNVFYCCHLTFLPSPQGWLSQPAMKLQISLSRPKHSTVTATNCSLCHTRQGTGRAGHRNNPRKPHTGHWTCALPGLAPPRLTKHLLTKVLEQSLPNFSMNKHQG